LSTTKISRQARFSDPRQARLGLDKTSRPGVQEPSRNEPWSTSARKGTPRSSSSGWPSIGLAWMMHLALPPGALNSAPHPNASTSGIITNCEWQGPAAFAAVDTTNTATLERARTRQLACTNDDPTRHLIGSASVIR
jgi:hypothetical protein